VEGEEGDFGSVAHERSRGEVSEGGRGGGGETSADRHSIGKSRNRTVVSRHTAIHFDTHCSSHCNTHCNTYCNTDYNTDYNTHCNTRYEHKGQARNDTDLEHCDVLKRV